MKNCILTGGGSKFGMNLTKKFLEQGYIVHLITSNGNAWHKTPNVNVINVNWNELDITTIRSLLPDVDYIDVIFFNHNASALSKEKFNANSFQNHKDWQQKYFVATQFPYYFIKTLSKKLDSNSKVGWMLSELITTPFVHHVGFADYMGNKFTNACIMKSFSMTNTSCFFSIYPEGGVDLDTDKKASNMVKLIDTTDCIKLNGNIFDSYGNNLNFFK